MHKQALPLSAVALAVSEAIDMYFDGQIITIKAEITDVKKYPQKKWCFLKFLEKNGQQIQTEMKGVFWNQGYGSIAKFEHQTGQKFQDGLEVICDVIVKFHPKFGLSLEVLDIDTAHTIGNLELERQKTINELVAKCPNVVEEDGILQTTNQSLRLPTVVQHIGLIAPPNSDGLRDFVKELKENRYGYFYHLEIFETQVQGDTAAKQLHHTLCHILQNYPHLQAIAIVRGGGSNTDFKPFDDYQVCATIAGAAIPIFTGIGHDRNTSIADLMAHQLKTPTKVANHFVEHNLNFETQLDQLFQRLQKTVHGKLSGLKAQLLYLDKTLEHFHPQKILQKGYAILKDTHDDIIEDARSLNNGDTLIIQTQKHLITTTINNIKEI